MKYKYRVAFFTCIMVLLVACSKDWLDEKVNKTQAVPGTARDFQAMLDNFTNISITSNASINEIAADGHFYTQAVLNTYAGSNYENIYSWSSINPFESVTDWNGPYSVVLNLNIIIDGVRKSEDQDEAGLNHVYAQALFNRARIFFNLAQTFAPPYVESSAHTDLGIPLRLSSDISVSSKRSSLEATYTQIIGDLKTAAEYLPEKPAYVTRASKHAVYAMLSKVYFYMEKYDSAREYANKCLGISNRLLDYNTISANASFIGVNEEVIFLSLLPSSPHITSQYLIDRRLFDSYDTNDLRKQVFFRAKTEGVEFKGYYSNSPTHVFAGLATDEIMLIRAECNARNANIPEAMKDLNNLLRTRWKKVNGASVYSDRTANNETDALTIIIKERQKQLILRNVRWSELRRINRDPRFSITLERYIGNRVYTLEPNSFRYTFPIPNDVKTKSGIQQNVGWEK